MPLEKVNEVAYTIAATAKGGRDGNVKSEDGVVDLPLGRPGNTSSPKANPETLFAAGYASCFSGALNYVAKEAGVDASDSTVTVDVTFGKTDTGFGLAADIKANIPGVDADKAQELVEKAHAFCPYSKATRGNIEVTVGVE
ncbi:Ohr family peroxiredoxin [Epidermidibacterium keratini]|uniref:Ohr family peroxiredoxin n=1 Tax=Epidermidibacterium keratini TaxID=1891644 RepID=A0A7L4YJS7_9ACTN|nr:organic hydroperoxide resistance protein [Epidermidibacterium keratini]QHB99524.1 Ohr family peroxiredoxin [Epidermidibacterium keratini]